MLGQLAYELTFDFAYKDVFKATGITRSFTTIEIKPNLLQQLNESVTVTGHVAWFLGMAIPVCKLHGLCLHDGAQETLNFHSFRIGDDFCDSSFGRIIVQQSDKGRVGWTTENTAVNVVKERILRLVFLPVRFLALA